MTRKELEAEHERIERLVDCLRILDLEVSRPLANYQTWLKFYYLIHEDLSGYRDRHLAELRKHAGV